jgi:homoserine kinase type II
MTELTKLSNQDVQALLAPYGISDITKVSLLSGGSENTNYKISTQKLSYVLTICEQKSISKSQQLTDLLDYLAANDFASSTVIKTLDGASVSCWDSKAIIVKSFIEGSIEKDLPDVMLNSLGNQLRHLHSLKAPSYLATTVDFGLERFELVKSYAADSEFCQWLDNTKQYVSDYISLNLPKSLIHSDIFYSNVIVAPNQQSVTIMDFEEAAHYYRIFDIGMLLIGTCCIDNQFKLEKAQHVMQGYQLRGRLSTHEIQALQAFSVYAAAATAFWRHQNYHYVNPTPDMFDHYLEMQQVAKQVRRIDPAEFIKVLQLS